MSAVTTPNWHWNRFADGAALADALADRVAQELARAIASRGAALIAVSGGTTPGRFFEVLSNRDLDWAKVTVTLVDERFVPATSPRSNSALVAATLLQNRARAADFVPLYRASASAEKAALEAGADLEKMSWPLDAAVLGMGGDGHTASFFPDAGGLDALLDPGSDKSILAVDAPGAGEPRLTLSLPRLADARFVALHIEGNTKRDVLEGALFSIADQKLPVRRVLDAAQRPVEIFWAP
nr:6-phosphogluconolactonase [Mesorhizobium sp. NBSH29]